MGQVKVILPAMGEGIFEATITQWLVSEGDRVEEDDSLVEIATDKVDTEVPAPATGTLTKVMFLSGDIAKINQVIAIIETDYNVDLTVKDTPSVSDDIKAVILPNNIHSLPKDMNEAKSEVPLIYSDNKFMSPLVRSIMLAEGISVNELCNINGTGLDGRITKNDILNYLHLNTSRRTNQVASSQTESSLPNSINDEIIEMGRMRKLIAKHMVQSKQTSPHVTSFHEVDVTDIVKWRDANKDDFLQRYGSKLTYTPIFIEAVVKAIEKYPLINISVDGDKIILKKSINIGVATSLPDGNLIVPVIREAKGLGLPELAIKVNDLAKRARSKQLQPSEIKGGTFTITNIGAFGNLSGTPIINQPEVAILAIGTIKKRPAVIETPQGDFIGIRHQMILSLSYDHRVVDGALGGMFLKQIADNMESFIAERHN